MFRIVCDPSSGSIELYLNEIIRSGSQIFECAWSVFGSVMLNQWCVCVCAVRRAGSQLVIPYTHTPLVQNYAAKHRPSTLQTSVNH